MIHATETLDFCWFYKAFGKFILALRDGNKVILYSVKNTGCLPLCVG